MKTAARRPVLKRHHEIATAFFATWTAIGLHLDVWAHIHRRPETLLTPWHGILYSGIALGVLYFVVDSARRGTAVSADRLTIAGFFIFAGAVVGDFIWHSIFGIETSLRAFMSPTHLTMMLGASLMVTGPLREARLHRDAYRSFNAFAPALVCVAVSVSLVTLFLQFLSPFNVGSLAPDLYSEVSGLAGVLIINTILIGVALFLSREFVPPFGTHTILFAVAAISAQSVQSFFRPIHIVAAAVAGIGVDLLIRSARDVKRRMLLVAIGGPFILWGLWLAGFALSGGIRWPAEIPGGIVLMAVFEGIALYAMLISSPAPTG